MGVHALYVYIENHFKLVHEMGGSYMRYTLDLIVSIGIIEFFQLVSILTFFVYSYMLVCMYAFYFK